MTHGSLFSGIGGFDLAAELMGWENIFHCEINTFCQTVLKHHFPNSILYENIKETDFTKHRGTIDVISGGFPCQPYSVAGKRKGKEDERHLWPEMLRAIREIQPTWVIGENVSGLINWNEGMVFDEVQADLETEGYEVIPFILPAAGVNAPHKRDRVWFVAYASGNGYDGESAQKNNTFRKNCKQSGTQRKRTIKRFSNERTTSDTPSQQSERLRFEQREYSEQKQGQFGGNDSWMGCKQYASNSSNTGLQGSQDFGSTEKIRPKRNEQFAGCIPSTWQNFPTQSPVCSGDDGLPRQLDDITFSKWRYESIKAYGNAVIPQIPFMIFQAIEKFNNQ